MDLFVIELAAERFVSNENSLLGESRSILPPQGGSEEIAVDLGEHTPTKKFLKILRYLRSSRFSIPAARYGK
jgi:hypothetical protein